MALEDFSWTDLITRIKRGAPSANIIVWCNEDTPIIWEDLMRAIAGLQPDVPLQGQTDMAEAIVSEEGIKALRTRVPTGDRTQAQDAIAAILEDHAQPDMLEDDISLPDLTPDVIEILTDRYDDDLDAIVQMDGVKLILPFES